MRVCARGGRGWMVDGPVTAIRTRSFRVYTGPAGEFVLSAGAAGYQYYVFFQNAHLCYSDRGLFSHSRLRRTQRARVYTTVQVWLLVGLRGACSGRSKPHKLVLFIGSLSAEPEPSWPMKTPTCHFSFFPHCFALLLFSSPQRLPSHGTTALVLRAFPFVTTTSGASACVCARECAYVRVGVIV